jgi:type IV pilus assembly protein PilE
VKKALGFTLIELMIVVAIIGVLAAIAYPSYMSSIRKSHRADAKVQLNDIAVRLQRCFTANSTFLTDASHGCEVKTLVAGDGINSPNNYYLIKGSNFDAAKYLLTATPIAGTTQAADTRCASFTLDQSGKKKAYSSSNYDVTDECW